MPISQSEDIIGLHQPMRGLDSDTVWWASDEMTDEQSPITQAAAGMEAFEKLEIRPFCSLLLQAASMSFE